MAKIDPLDRRPPSWPVVPGQLRRRHAGAESAPEQVMTAIPAAVAPLVDAIDETGSALMHDPTGAHLEDYKQAVRRFLDTALQASLEVHSEATYGLAQKAFSTIARIDVSLAELTDAVIGRQQDVLKMRELVDQIKGLIVDLYR